MTLDGFLRTAERLFDATISATFNAWGIAIGDACWGHEGAEIRWDDGKPYIAPVGEAIPEGECEAYGEAIFTPAFTAQLVGVYQATWGGSSEEAAVNISLWDRYSKRDELMTDAIILLNIGVQPLFSEAGAASFWAQKGIMLPLMGKHGQLSMFGAME